MIDGGGRVLKNSHIFFRNRVPVFLMLDAAVGSSPRSLQKKGMKVTGIDFSGRMLAIAKRAARRGFSTRRFVCTFSFNEKFDGIFAQAVLLHFPKKDMEGIIGSLKEKLKSGGYFYMAVKQRREGEGEEEIVKENDYGYAYERFFSYFTIAGNEAIFHRAKAWKSYTRISSLLEEGIGYRLSADRHNRSLEKRALNRYIRAVPL